MSKVRVSYSGVGDMLRSDFILAELQRRARRVESVAEATAPFDRNGVTQHYKESFSISSSSTGGIHHDRAEVLVLNDDADAIYVEYGTGVDRPRPQGGSSPRHATLRRALDSASG